MMKNISSEKVPKPEVELQCRTFPQMDEALGWAPALGKRNTSNPHKLERHKKHFIYPLVTPLETSFGTLEF